MRRHERVHTLHVGSMFVLFKIMRGQRCNQVCIYIYTWNPNGPCFDWKRPCFEGLTFKNRGQWGSRHLHITYCILLHLSLKLSISLGSRYVLRKGFPLQSYSEDGIETINPTRLREVWILRDRSFKRSNHKTTYPTAIPGTLSSCVPFVELE